MGTLAFRKAIASLVCSLVIAAALAGDVPPRDRRPVLS